MVPAKLEYVVKVLIGVAFFSVKLSAPGFCLTSGHFEQKTDSPAVGKIWVAQSGFSPELPPATFTMPENPSVKVPPLNRPQSLPAATPVKLPPNEFFTNQTATVKVPPLQSPTANSPRQLPARSTVPLTQPVRVSTPVKTPVSSLVIEFGQPLPKTRP